MYVRGLMEVLEWASGEISAFSEPHPLKTGITEYYI